MVKTRNAEQVKGRLNHLNQLIKAGVPHPDSDILRTLERQQSEPNYWTRKELNTLLSNLKKSGIKDYQKLSKALKNKNAANVRDKTKQLCREIESDPKHEFASHFEALTTIAPNIRVWTEKENARFAKVLQQHGKDYN